jgi:error-prone DNA polymerase
MCYQEDVTKAAMAIGGFDVVKAEDLRKALSKKRPFKKLAQYKKDFYQGALAQGVQANTIEKIWEMMMSFSGYSFCKPHSASFALLSFKSAYVKSHYPAEFIAAVITNQGGYYSAFEYVSEARRMGLEIRLPDVNESEKGYTGAGKQVRVGLMQLKGLNEKAIDAILTERKTGRFESFADFARRVALDPSDLRILIKAGCFDSISQGETRPGLMWKLHLSRSCGSREDSVLSFFDSCAPHSPSVADYDEEKMLKDEIEVLGFLVSRHPLSLYEEKIARIDCVRAGMLGAHVGKRVQTVGWLVTGKTVSTRTDEPMEFVSFEDTTAIYEATFFPEAYRRYSHLLGVSRPYLITGRVESDLGAIYLCVEKAVLLDEAASAQEHLPCHSEAGPAVAAQRRAEPNESETALEPAIPWARSHC